MVSVKNSVKSGRIYLFITQTENEIWIPTMLEIDVT